jgi:hypothetical protein
VDIFLIFLVPLFIGLLIGANIKQWSVVAIIVGVPLFIPATATIIPALIATKADSIWFYAIPCLGVGLSVGGLIGAVKILVAIIGRGSAKA